QYSAPAGSRRSGGAMPTMVNGVPSSRTVDPTTPERAPKRRRHTPSLMTTTGGAPTCPSASTKARPAWGTTPGTPKKDVVTVAPPSCWGSPGPVTLADGGVIAAAPEKPPFGVVTS